MEQLIKTFRSGNIRSLARIISKMENEDPSKDQLLKKIFHLTGIAYVVGVTGSPGAGKSSLVDRITAMIRKKGETVGIIAVDPTSPFSGGALLGDRVRMQDHAADNGVYIRSMGTRGSLGGLARATRDAVKVMDAYGYHWIIVETVGVGQAELDIINVADTTMVVLTPGTGDSIQAIKAGIMEIADIFAVNKSDLPGVDKVSLEIEQTLDIRGSTEWRPPVNQVSTLDNQGMSELMDSLEKHRSYLTDSGLLECKRQERLRKETLEIVDHRWHNMVYKQFREHGYLKDVLKSVIEKKKDPYTAASEILDYMIERSG